jgi:hypothetical protein
VTNIDIEIARSLDNSRGQADTIECAYNLKTDQLVFGFLANEDRTGIPEP